MSELGITSVLLLVSVAAFLAVWKLDALAFIYDARVAENGIEFVLFASLKVYLLSFANIEHVEEVKGGYLLLFVYNFKNRLFRRTFLIKKKRGFFTRRVLVTPANPDEFAASLARAGVRVTCLGGSSIES